MLTWTEARKFGNDVFTCTDCSDEIKLYFLPNSSGNPRLECLACNRKVEIGLYLENVIRSVINGEV